MTIVPDTGWHRASLGLGGNIGDPRLMMANALQIFEQRSDCRVVAVSRLYRTPPWGRTDQADFFNACALLDTQLAPDDLLATCLEIERSMKRERLERWGPRTIDIDVLTYDSLEQDGVRLSVPHPRMTERGFVLMPLADIAPDMMVKGMRVAEWLGQADVAGIEIADESLQWWRTE